jgi:hypothetical protein
VRSVNDSGGKEGKILDDISLDEWGNSTGIIVTSFDFGKS